MYKKALIRQTVRGQKNQDRGPINQKERGGSDLGCHDSWVTRVGSNVEEVDGGELFSFRPDSILKRKEREFNLQKVEILI